MKYTRSYKPITPFGGVVPVLNKLKKLGLPQQIRKCLGARPKQSTYSHEDIIISYMMMTFCGAKRLLHSNKKKHNLEMIPGLQIPDHTTTGRAFKTLATETKVEVLPSRIRAKSGSNSKTKTVKSTTTRETCENDKLNRLLVKTTKSLGLLRKDKKYIVDMDATFIPSNCTTARRSFHNATGFYPMVSSIGKLPVYISMRNGNTAPAAETKECLERTLGYLRESEITVDKVRMDGAGYSISALDYLNEEEIKFYVAGADKPNIVGIVHKHTEWSPFELETATVKWECEASDFRHTLHDSKFEYRIVALRATRKGRKNPHGWIEKKEYSYRLYITNDFKSSKEEIVKLYNQRGSAEKNFDMLKNDFNWANIPFRQINEALVFLLIAALTNNVYQALIRTYHKHVKELQLKSRLSDFIFYFMTVVCEITGDECIFYSKDTAYEKIC
ncbi:MAG: IS1380 family transposase [Bacteroidota bacterium]